MKLTTAILVLGMTAGAAWAQGVPNILQNVKDKMNTVQQQKTADSNAALSVAEGQASKPAVKPAVSQAKPAAAQPISVSKPAAKPVAAVKPATTTKSSVVAVKPSAATKASVAAKPKAVAKEAKPKAASEPKKETVSVENKKGPEPEKKDTEKAKIISASGRRDPFISPVVSQSAVGSGCSTGKRCLAVGQISLKGVVKAETGMIAVVVNALDKAYFLRENDPVFDGYVMKITGDSIVFKETVQDKLGKPFTREVTKKITTPVV